MSSYNGNPGSGAMEGIPERIRSHETTSAQHRHDDDPGRPRGGDHDERPDRARLPRVAPPFPVLTLGPSHGPPRLHARRVTSGFINSRPGLGRDAPDDRPG